MALWAGLGSLRRWCRGADGCFRMEVSLSTLPCWSKQTPDQDQSAMVVPARGYNSSLVQGGRCSLATHTTKLWLSSPSARWAHKLDSFWLKWSRELALIANETIEPEHRELVGFHLGGLFHGWFHDSMNVQYRDAVFSTNCLTLHDQPHCPWSSSATELSLLPKD